MPIGVALSRLAWGAVADELGIASVPVTSIALLALVVPAMLVVANAVALVPAWLARRTKPAIALRAE